VIPEIIKSGITQLIWLGFILEIEGVKVYHARDCNFILEMKDLEVDTAVLPVSYTYSMIVDHAV